MERRRLQRRPRSESPPLPRRQTRDATTLDDAVDKVTDKYMRMADRSSAINLMHRDELRELVAEEAQNMIENEADRMRRRIRRVYPRTYRAQIRLEDPDARAEELVTGDYMRRVKQSIAMRRGRRGPVDAIEPPTEQGWEGDVEAERERNELLNGPPPPTPTNAAQLMREFFQ